MPVTLLLRAFHSRNLFHEAPFAAETFSNLFLLHQALVHNNNDNNDNDDNDNDNDDNDNNENDNDNNDNDNDNNDNDNDNTNLTHSYTLTLDKHCSQNTSCSNHPPQKLCFFCICWQQQLLTRKTLPPACESFLDFCSDLAAIREPHQAPMLKITEVWTRGIEIPLKAESGSCCLARHRSTRIRQWSNFSLHCFSSQRPSFDLTYRPKPSHHSKSRFKTRIGKDMQRHLATSARFFNIPASKLMEVSPQAPIKLSRGEIAFRKGFAVIVEAGKWD